MITFTRGKLSKMSGVHIETIRFTKMKGCSQSPKERITAIVYMIKICTHAVIYHRSEKARFLT